MERISVGSGCLPVAGRRRRRAVPACDDTAQGPDDELVLLQHRRQLPPPDRRARLFLRLQQGRPARLPDPVAKSHDVHWRVRAEHAATGGEKTYAANRTAARDIAASFGNFVPETLYTPQSPSMSLPDLVILPPIRRRRARAASPSSNSAVSRDQHVFCRRRLAADDPRRFEQIPHLLAQLQLRRRRLSRLHHVQRRADQQPVHPALL